MKLYTIKTEKTVFGENDEDGCHSLPKKEKLAVSHLATVLVPEGVLFISRGAVPTTNAKKIMGTSL